MGVDGAKKRQYAAGERVAVYFDNAGWQTGVVEGPAKRQRPGPLCHRQYVIAFDDGTKEEDVSNAEMRPEEMLTNAPFKAGDRVVVYFENAGWHTGTVEGRISIRDDSHALDTYSVLFDDATRQNDVTALQMQHAEGGKSEQEQESLGAVVAEDTAYMEARLEVGDRLEAEDCKGRWCDAKVTSERGSGNERQLKVHFHGFGSRYDEWISLGAGRLRPLPGSGCASGDYIIACDKADKWCEAKVISTRMGVEGRELKVHFIGFGSKYDEIIPVGVGRFRPIPIGQHSVVGNCLIACDKHGDWYDAKVVAVRDVYEGRQLKMQFHGFGPRHDEWITVGNGKLRPVPAGHALAMPPMSSTAHAVKRPQPSDAKHAAAPIAPASSPSRPASSLEPSLSFEPAPSIEPPPASEEELPASLSLGSLSPGTASAVAAQWLVGFGQAGGSTQATQLSSDLPHEIRGGLEALELQLRCPWCAHVLHNPQVLPCQHAYCKACVENVLAAGRKESLTRCTVPVGVNGARCNQPFFRREIKESRLLEGLVQTCKALTAAAAVPSAPQ